MPGFGTQDWEETVRRSPYPYVAGKHWGRQTERDGQNQENVGQEGSESSQQSPSRAHLAHVLVAEAAP